MLNGHTCVVGDTQSPLRTRQSRVTPTQTQPALSLSVNQHELRAGAAELSREAGLQLVPLRVDDPRHHVGEQVGLQRRELHEGGRILPRRLVVREVALRVGLALPEHFLEGLQRHLVQPLFRRMVVEDGVVARVRLDPMEGIAEHLPRHTTAGVRGWVCVGREQALRSERRWSLGLGCVAGM